MKWCPLKSDCLEYGEQISNYICRQGRRLAPEHTSRFGAQFSFYTFGKVDEIIATVVVVIKPIVYYSNTFMGSIDFLLTKLS